MTQEELIEFERLKKVVYELKEVVNLMNSKSKHDQQNIIYLWRKYNTNVIEQVTSWKKNYFLNEIL